MKFWELKKKSVGLVERQAEEEERRKGEKGQSLSATDGKQNKLIGTELSF